MFSKLDFANKCLFSNWLPVSPILASYIVILFHVNNNTEKTKLTLAIISSLKLDHIKACQKSLLLVYQKLIWAWHSGQKVKFGPPA